jgi:hypothetical protein
LNTDPWVFHPGFVWSICRHQMLTMDLRSGDVVLFGSTVQGEWLLDTVFVVDKRLGGTAGEISGVYDRLVRPTIGIPFQPFVGRPYKSLKRSFSFVPAARADERHMPFPRPSMNALFRRSLRKNKDGQPPSPRNAQALVVCTAIGGAQSFWSELVRQVEKAGLVLGILCHHPSADEQLPTNAVAAAECGKPKTSKRRPIRRCN